jgi:hypothetical protein
MTVKSSILNDKQKKVTIQNSEFVILVLVLFIYVYVS